MKNLIIIVFAFLFILSSKKNQFKNLGFSTKIEFLKLEKAVLASGSLYRVDSFPSKYITPRSVDVWLPESYSKDKKYSVLYMHDGQNLFDSTTTWNKQEWKVDDWATKLNREGKVKDFIVVGIHNIPQIRWLDLFPEKAMDFIDKDVKANLMEMAKQNNLNTNLKGDEYLKFLVEELKPVIDNQYSVHTDKESTFVMGSSMGGLMSMYAISEYPEVFGGAGCVSTHWVGAMPSPNNPYPEAIFNYMEANLPKSGNHKLYFDYGNKTLDQHYPQYAPRIDKILKTKGYTEQEAMNLFFEGTDHSENSWNKRLDQPLTFLLGK
ncbi:alpha/beta hydrolase-fold protein [uncultured Winogradskyella sp.]|uniref:alpha/beta hydrolase n=1 Tax=uncultured Winogradskyella sp. TaxID=395353 RepID=UPI00262D47BA|nr:alpha/beta hydrolase-fold protein [uncultured Winogradskyella sp.]